MRIAPVCRVSRLAACLIVALAVWTAVVAAAQLPAVDRLAQLHDAITAAVRAPGVERGVWGIVVHSLSRNEDLFELNPSTLLVPGSIVKLVSAATAAEAVGWDYQFETTLHASGPIVDGTLQGDLLVVGSGDPTLGGRSGDNLSVWITALKSLGLTEIAGRVIADDDNLQEPRPQLAWGWDDLGYTAGAIFGALNLGENVMTVTVAPASVEGGMTTLSADPSATDRPLINRSTTGARGSRQLVWPEQRPGETALTIAGSIPAGASPLRLTVSVGNPTLWFANVLRRCLQLEGIAVTGGAFDVDDVIPHPDRESSTLLYTYKSHPLFEIVQPLLKDSVNLYGEALMRLNAPPDAFKDNDAALEGLGLRLEAWGIAADSQQLVDGSGMSRRSVISPDAILQVLKHMHDPTGLSPFMTALAVAGVDGSLENRLRDTAAAGNVRAKTGTMTNIRSLAGYVTTRDGEPLAFVIMVNNFEGEPRAALSAIDFIAVALAEFSRRPS